MEIVNVSRTVSQDFQKISKKDRDLVSANNINTVFGLSPDDKIELYIYDSDGNLLLSDYDATDYYPQLVNPTNSGFSTLTLDPETDVKNRGFNRGNLSIQYNFYRNLFSSNVNFPYWIKEISTSRREIKLASQNLSDASIDRGFATYQAYITSKNYYPVFYLNFGNNVTIIANNAALSREGDGSYLLIKLYEPLPSEFDVKTQLWIIDKIADSVSFNIDIKLDVETTQNVNTLRGPNYAVNVNLKTGQTTPYYSYNSLIVSPVSSSYQKMRSFYQDKAIELNIDYSDFSNFIHFSSATQRVNNFVYKLQQIESASANINASLALISGGSIVSSSISAEQKFINGVIENFDIYEYFLYFESSSWAWPKSNSTQPYELYSVTSSKVISFLGSENLVPNATTASLLFSASYYDSTNKDILHQSIPQYVIDDPSNQPFITFLDMIGQHFDNIWVYYKDVSNRYDATNNPKTGISLDLVSDALRGLGMQLYTNTNVSDNLYYTMFGINPDGSLLPPTGSEWITNYVTSSIATLPAEQLQDEVYKRLYHNLPYLLKTKGTARGIKTLIQSYGIPDSMLKVREFGGNPYNESNGVIDMDSSEYKIFIDTGSLTPSPTFIMSEVLEYIQSEDSNPFITDFPIDPGTVTGSLTISSSLLSPYTTLQYYVGNRRLNSANLEIGFSPSDTINAEISASQGTFIIDQLIGSPGYRYSSSYEPLVSASNAYFSSYTQPNSVWEYIRLLKFYNNSLFKIIKDFVPIRANASTGIIVKSHLYERNKYARHEPSMSVEIYSQSIDMISISGSDGGSIIGDTDYIGHVMTVSGSVYYVKTQDIEKYTGELSGSYLVVTTGKPFPQTEISQRPAPFVYNEVFVSESGTDYIIGERTGVPPSPDPENAFILTENQIGNPYYVTQLNAVFQNVTASVKSQILLDLDYSGNQQKPINYSAITYSLSRSIFDNYNTYTNPNNPYAQVQDYNYNLQRSILPRYSGSRTISSTYNDYTIGDKSYGKTAAIDKIKYQYAYLVNIYSSSFQLPNRAKAQIKYIIDDNQNVINLSKTNSNIFAVQNIFKAGEWADVSLFDYDPDNPYIVKLNNDQQDFTIWESGYVYSPILFNVNGKSTINFSRAIPSSSEEITTIPGSDQTINSTDIDYWTVGSGQAKVTRNPGGVYIEAYFTTASNATKTTTLAFTVTNNTYAANPTYQTFTAFTPSGANKYTASYTLSPITNNWQTGDSLTVTINQRTYRTPDVSFTSSVYYVSASDNTPYLDAVSLRQVVLSTTQSLLYGNIVQIQDPSLQFESQMDTPVFPLDINKMDMLRLYNTASQFSGSVSEYRVVSVVLTTYSSSFRIGLNLDRDIQGTDTDLKTIPSRISKYMLLKRIPDETVVNFNYDLPQPINSDGTLFPQYTGKGIKENSGNVIKALKQQNLI